MLKVIGTAYVWPGVVVHGVGPVQPPVSHAQLLMVTVTSVRGSVDGARLTSLPISLNE